MRQPTETGEESDVAEMASGLIVRQTEPRNFESPVAAFGSFLTAPHLFYVRNHFAVPDGLASDWRLRVEGCVERTLALGPEDLARLPSATATVTLECAGNGRVRLTPAEKGVQWDGGAVGTAEWTGVPLAAVLELAGLRPGAQEVILEGADEGEEADPKTPGTIHYARSLPLEKARGGGVLLARQMNGQALSENHGHPLRAIVPGWYGMASVKWLRRIMITDRPFHGYFQSMEYSRWERVAGLPSLQPLTEMGVKAEIVHPARHGRVPRSALCRVSGLAWAGEAAVAAVAISVGEEGPWAEAQLLDAPRPHVWVRWRYDWRTPAGRGPCLLRARARDDRGRAQPMGRNRDERSYAVHHVVEHPVEVG